MDTEDSYVYEQKLTTAVVMGHFQDICLLAILVKRESSGLGGRFAELVAICLLTSCCSRQQWSECHNLPREGRPGGTGTSVATEQFQLSCECWCRRHWRKGQEPSYKVPWRCLFFFCEGLQERRLTKKILGSRVYTGVTIHSTWAGVMMGQSTPGCKRQTTRDSSFLL